MKLEPAARAVLEGANSMYGRYWRTWAGNPAATDQAQAYGAALLALETALKRIDAVGHPLKWTDEQVAAERHRIAGGGAGGIADDDTVTMYGVRFAGVGDYVPPATTVAWLAQGGPEEIRGWRDDLAILERGTAAGQPRTLGRVAAKLRNFWTRRHRPTN